MGRWDLPLLRVMIDPQNRLLVPAVGKGSARHVCVPGKLIEDIDDAGHFGCSLIITLRRARPISRLVGFVCEPRQCGSVPMFVPQGDAQSLDCDAWTKRVKDQVRVLALCSEAKVKDDVNTAHSDWP